MLQTQNLTAPNCFSLPEAIPLTASAEVSPSIRDVHVMAVLTDHCAHWISVYPCLRAATLISSKICSKPGQSITIKNLPYRVVYTNANSIKNKLVEFNLLVSISTNSNGVATMETPLNSSPADSEAGYNNCRSDRPDDKQGGFF